MRESDLKLDRMAALIPNRKELNEVKKYFEELRVKRQKKKGNELVSKSKLCEKKSRRKEIIASEYSGQLSLFDASAFKDAIADPKN